MSVDHRRPDAASARLPRTVEAVDKLGSADMQTIFATQFADEIAAPVVAGGGRRRRAAAVIASAARNRE